MKVAIVTFIRAYNHGAVLQCYALNRVLSEKGMDVEVLDYYPKYFYNTYHLSQLGRLRYFPYRPLRNWIKYTPMLQTLNKRTKGFEVFIHNNIKLSKKRFYSFEELQNEKLSYGAYISGSDQVWCDKWTGFDPAYFLDFVSEKKTMKLSYAASFGYDNLPDNLVSEYTRRLTGWNSYSVREPSGQRIINELLGEEAIQCCDPTLLLSKNEWEKISKRTKYDKKDYVLIYYVNSVDNLLDAAATYCKKYQCQAISVTSIASYDDLIGCKTKERGFIHYGACSPDELISLIANAKCVITDSFHGTVFSLLFHKKFISKIKHNSTSVNIRIFDLLKMVNALDRGELENIDLLDVEPDWKRIDTILVDYRKKSIEYIDSIITMMNERVNND